MISVWELGEEDFLLVGSMKEQLFDTVKLRKRHAENPTLQQDLIDLGLTDLSEVLNFYRMGRKQLVAFSRGAGINTDDGAQLEYSAPMNLRRDTSDLNRELMEPFFVPAPWPELGLDGLEEEFL